MILQITTFWGVINTNTGLPSVNTIQGSFETVYLEKHKFTGSEEEKNWIGKAIEDIKMAEKGIKLKERISHQVGTLKLFFTRSNCSFGASIKSRVKWRN